MNSMASNGTSNTSMSMVDNFWMRSFSLVRDIHDSSTIVSISSVLDILNPSIRESNLILSYNVAILITSSVLTEVCVVMIIMYSIFKLEWIRLFMIVTPMTMYWTTMTHYTTNSCTMTSSNKSNSCRDSIGKSEGREQGQGNLHG